MKYFTKSISAVFCILSISACTEEKIIQADSIYIDGNIITMNDVQPSAEAIAIKDGLILAIGDSGMATLSRTFFLRSF